MTKKLIKQLIVLLVLVILLIGRFEITPFRWQLWVNPSHGVHHYALDNYVYESSTTYKGIMINAWWIKWEKEGMQWTQPLLNLDIHWGILDSKAKLYKEKEND